jgi:protein-S-isoprenylcysteine O-methyltransferase Ste14
VVESEGVDGLRGGARVGVQSWRFFANRIPYEEKLLVDFFGGEYIQYRHATPTWLPFIA